MSLLRIARNAAESEDFGDEIVVIDAASGAFYSLRGRAMSVWRACERGVEPSALDRALGALDAGERNSIAAMIAELRRAGIIVETPADGAPATDLTWGDLPPAQFHRNDDFNDLIRLDPIHDVSDQGWPRR